LISFVFLRLAAITEKATTRKILEGLGLPVHRDLAAIPDPP